MASGHSSSASKVDTCRPVNITKMTSKLIQRASREKPFLIEKAQLRKMEFDYDIPGGCVVRLVLLNGTKYEGIQFINPKNDITSRSFKLIKAFKVNPVDHRPMSAEISGIIEFRKTELDRVYILEYTNPNVKRSPEMIMETFVVTTRVQFNNLMSSLTSGHITEVGLKLFGFNKGRFMDLFWIVLCVRQTLIPIDMKEELNSSEIWFELKEKVFENKSILKIVHDLRYDTDFLCHSAIDGIHITNVFDCQLAIYFMDTRARYMERRRYSKKHPGTQGLVEHELILNKLSLAVMRYLGNQVSEREINLLFKFESDDWTQAKDFTERPFPDPKTLKYMALTVKYLSLLKAELLSDMLLCYDVCCQKLMHHMHIVSHGEAAEIVEHPSRLPEKLVGTMETYATAMNLETERSRYPDLPTSGSTKLHGGR